LAQQSETPPGLGNADNVSERGRAVPANMKKRRSEEATYQVAVLGGVFG
jgi:hypothetical protein